MAERIGIRKIDSGMHPYDASTGVRGSIGETTITAFCKGCDFLPPSNICEIVGSNDQARYASRQLCNWASVNGQRGGMTAEGFIPSKQEPPKT